MKKIVIGLCIAFSIIACEAVFVEDVSNEKIVLIAPSNNVLVKGGNVNFSWEAIAAIEKYQLQVATPNFINASQILLDTLVTKPTFIQDLKEGDYEWRVRGVNSGYTTSYTANVFKVTDADLSKITTELIVPLHNSIDNTAKQKLTWKPVSEANEYRLQIWSPDESGTLIKDTVMIEDAYDFTFPDGVFKWKVRAQNASQNGIYASRVLTIDTKKPSVPENTTPTNGFSQKPGTVNFSWTRIDVPGTIETDSIYVFTDTALKVLSFKGIGADKSFTKDDMTIGEYHWYVQAFDEATNESVKSNRFKLTINN